MVAPLNHVLDQNAVIPKKLDSEVYEFLKLPHNLPIILWLDDTDSLIKNAREGRSSLGNTPCSYYDYSFMITPAFKALEHWIIQIAPRLGVKEELVRKAKEQGQFNKFLNDDDIQILVDDVLSKIEEKAKTKMALRSSLVTLSSYLKNLRHTPAHAGKVIERVEQAETYFHEIVGAINRITKLLIEAGIIKVQINPIVESSNRAMRIKRQLGGID